MKTTAAAIPGLASLILLTASATLLFASPSVPPNFDYDLPDLERFLSSGQSEELHGSITNIGDESTGFEISIERIAAPQGGEGAEWLSVQPAAGEIAVGERVDLTITFSAIDALPGDYAADMHFLSSDPNDPDVAAAAMMHVQGMPDIMLSWPEESGFPNEINWNGVYLDLFPGGPYSVAIDVSNRSGDEDLTLDEISATPGQFSVEPASMVVDPNSTSQILVTFGSQEAGEYNGTLTIVSNDPDQGQVEIPLHAEAVGPPVVGPDNWGLDEELFTGQVEEYELVLENQGDALLRFIIETEIIDEPQRDESKRAIRSLDEKTRAIDRASWRAGIPDRPNSKSRSHSGRSGMPALQETLKINTPKDAIPRRDDAGDLLAAFGDWPNIYKNLAWDPENELMWLMLYNNAMAFALSFDRNYEFIQEVMRINPGNCMDGTWARGLYFCPTWGANRVNRYNSNGQNVGAIQLPFQVAGLAADVEEGWLMVQDLGDQSIHVYPLDDDGGIGDELGVIRNHLGWNQNEWSLGLEWVHAHPDGQLWLANRNNGRVTQILVDTDSWECVEEVQNFVVFPNDAQQYCAVAHDGRNLWAGGFRNPDVRVYDDGVAEQRWLMVEPTEGEIPPGESVVITITLDATGLIGGDYDAELHVFTNDPANPDLVYSVHMWVPEDWPLMLFWPEEFGWPDVLAFGRAVEDNFVGVPETLYVNLPNDGTDTLTITDAAFDNQVFTISPTEAVIEPGEDLDFQVIFLAEDPGEYQGTGTIWTDDPVYEMLDFIAIGYASLPPRIATFPESDGNIVVRWAPGNANPGDREIEIFNAAADGAADLRWQIAEDAEWLNCNPAEGRLEPDSSLLIVLAFETQGLEEDLYETDVIIASNDPDLPEVRITVTLSSVGFDDPHWPPWHQGPNHSVLVTDVRFDGDQVARGWEVGVFTPAGVMAGGGVWQRENLGIAVWGADGECPNYFNDGERMIFKLWDPNSNTEYDALPRVAEGGLEWEENGFTILSLDNRQPQNVLALRQGWNLVSFNFTPMQEYWRGPFGPDLRLLFRQFRDDQNDPNTSKIVLIKDERGRFYAIRGYDFLMIPYWNLTEGYQILTSEACEGDWAGQQIAPDADIPLTAGWNIIAYYPTYQLSASRASYFYVLSPIIDHVLIAKDDEGHFMVPASNFSNMNPWREGKGYQVKVDADVTLNYPAQQRMMMRDDDDAADVKPLRFHAVERTGKNMSMILDCGLQIAECGEIGVFTAKGRCIGAAAFRNPHSEIRNMIGLAVWGDDPSTEVIDGAGEGGALEFRLWDGRVETPIILKWCEGKAVYETDGLAIGQIIDERAGTPVLPATVTFYGASPNPFNSTTEIRYALPEAASVSLALVDLEGKTVATLFDGEQSAGLHIQQVDGGSLATGTYFVRLTAGRETRTAKISMIK